MSRPSLLELERRCQKPAHRTVGNWMARRVTRPLALRVTWLVQPWGPSAHAATLAAWAAAVAAAAALGWGTTAGWLLGAGLLQLWYLLDHVDGQLARLHRTASLDGVQLDYLMHHTVNLLVPVGMGWGLASRHAEPLWHLAGLGCGVGLLLVGLRHDARYKAFIKRLKRVRGELRVIGGGGSRPSPTPPVPRRPLPICGWAARKFCETHVLMNTVTCIAVGGWLLGDATVLAGGVYLVLLTVLALLLAAFTTWRGVRREEAEAEFARWFRPAEGDALVFEDGWWRVHSPLSPRGGESRGEGAWPGAGHAEPQEAASANAPRIRGRGS